MKHKRKRYPSILDNKTIFIHFGNDHYEKEMINESDNLNNNNKPKFGLWGCREQDYRDKYVWNDWQQTYNIDSKFLDKYFKFCLKSNTKILTIYGGEELYKIDKYIFYDEYDFKYIDFNKIKSDGYDGLELIHGENYSSIHDTDLFYTWDVDSIVVWNKDCIEQLKMGSH